MKTKKEFSKSLLIQESILIWLITVAAFVLAFFCVISNFTASLPWISAMVGLPWAAYGVSQAFYYNKAKAENVLKISPTPNKPGIIDINGPI